MIDRRLFLSTLAAASVAPSSAQQSRRPNIIFFLADDLGYGDLGCFGKRDSRRSAIDQMAAEGMRFTDRLRRQHRLRALSLVAS